MKTPHPHPELLHAIADGGLDAAKEFECHKDDWRFDQYAPIDRIWFGSIITGPHLWQVRRKPRTVKIGSRVVQAGITEAPEVGTLVWEANPTSTKYARAFEWRDLYRTSLQHGLIHLSEEPACAMGEALAIVAKGEE